MLGIMGLTVDALVSSFNLFIVGVAALATTFLALLPAFPAAPDAPSDGILGFIVWLVPLGGMITAFAGFTACWITFLGLKIALRWVKAL
jgi:hypothetical protein